MLVPALAAGAVLLAMVPSTAMVTPARIPRLALYHFVGKVSDSSGRPIVGADVSDGGQYVLTNSLGGYSIPEASPGTFTLRAWRKDTNQVTKKVSVIFPRGNKTVNFTLQYN
jgi:Carboxypeptidase regulatory-like domain